MQAFAAVVADKLVFQVRTGLGEQRQIRVDAAQNASPTTSGPPG